MSLYTRTVLATPRCICLTCCSCLNSKSIGQNKNVNLPGVHVDLPVLTSKDINDLVNFAVRHQMDFVAASFVQSGDDVR
jgi:pyruvate kinase